MESIVVDATTRDFGRPPSAKPLSCRLLPAPPDDRRVREARTPVGTYWHPRACRGRTLGCPRGEFGGVAEGFAAGEGPMTILMNAEVQVFAVTTEADTVVTEGYAASIPASIRRKLGIQPGDRLAWELQGDRIAVRVKRSRRRAFQNFRPYDFGAPTDATREHDEVL